MRRLYWSFDRVWMQSTRSTAGTAWHSIHRNSLRLTYKAYRYLSNNPAWIFKVRGHKLTEHGKRKESCMHFEGKFWDPKRAETTIGTIFNLLCHSLRLESSISSYSNDRLWIKDRELTRNFDGLFAIWSVECDSESHALELRSWSTSLWESKAESLCLAGALDWSFGSQAGLWHWSSHCCSHIEAWRIALTSSLAVRCKHKSCELSGSWDRIILGKSKTFDNRNAFGHWVRRWDSTFEVMNPFWSLTSAHQYSDSYAYATRTI